MTSAKVQAANLLETTAFSCFETLQPVPMTIPRQPDRNEGKWIEGLRSACVRGVGPRPPLFDAHGGTQELRQPVDLSLVRRLTGGLETLEDLVRVALPPVALEIIGHEQHQKPEPTDGGAMTERRHQPAIAVRQARRARPPAHA